MIILGIETSCDETAISIIEAEGDLESLSFKTLSHVIHSQIKDHVPFGGVVPNIAKREHIRNLPYVLIEALDKAGLIFPPPRRVAEEATISSGEPSEHVHHTKAKEFWVEFFEKLPQIKIDLIAVTVGPGLEPALWTGIEFAKELGEKLGVKVVGANHMEGHIASVLLNKTETNTKSEALNSKQNSKIEFPAVALLVSGGHTELIYLKNWQEKEKVGETLDDAVGEAFDKVARMLSLPYPGGPQISALAEEARIKNLESGIKFPRPMIRSGDLNFSFSGLKTAVLYYLKSNPQKQNRLDQPRVLPAEKSPPNPESTGPKVALDDFVSGEKPKKDIDRENNFPYEFKAMVAREFEDAAIETLVSKTKDAIEKYNPKTLIAGGGVIANKKLRKDLATLKESYPELTLLIPENKLSTDNATMIAVAGYVDYLMGKETVELRANGNLSVN